MDEQLLRLIEGARTREPEALGSLALELVMRGYPRPAGDDRAAIEALRAQRDRLGAELLAQARGYLQEGARRIFARFPHVESFSWHQYTPYFADGEPCVFEAWTRYASINGEDSYFGDDDTSMEAVVQREVVALLIPLSNELLLALFGDHQVVRVTPQGVFVEEFEHE